MGYGSGDWVRFTIEQRYLVPESGSGEWFRRVGFVDSVCGEILALSQEG